MDAPWWTGDEDHGVPILRGSRFDRRPEHAPTPLCVRCASVDLWMAVAKDGGWVCVACQDAEKAAQAQQGAA